MFKPAQIKTLPKTFFQHGAAKYFLKPQLIIFNAELAKELEFSGDGVTEEELAKVFSGQSRDADNPPVALAYAGHQFGHFVPQLGDGRALLLGELQSKNGDLFEVQLKGAGPTHFSRRGDGLAALGPVLREYLVSEAMMALKIPTTRALAAVATGESVRREEALPGAVLTRVARSHLRVGTVEYFAARNDVESLRALLNFAVERLDPDLIVSPDLELAFYQRVAERQCRLVAHWMSVGFIHGVMNTDNVALSGETLDFGPCAFMDEFRFDQVFSFIDQQGRYAYWNQPTILQWNLARLAEGLLLLSDKKKQSGESFEQILAEAMNQFKLQWLGLMAKKIGLQSASIQDLELIQSWLQLLQNQKLDFTQAHLALGDPKRQLEFFSNTPDWQLFFNLRETRLQAQGLGQEEVREMMSRVNPIYISRNHLIERAIQEAHQGSFEFFHELHQMLQKPFDRQAGKEMFERPPTAAERIKNTFCGT